MRKSLETILAASLAITGGLLLNANLNPEAPRYAILLKNAMGAASLGTGLAYTGKLIRDTYLSRTYNAEKS